jgi:hypothetical protein
MILPLATSIYSFVAGKTEVTVPRKRMIAKFLTSDKQRAVRGRKQAGVLAVSSQAQKR